MSKVLVYGAYNNNNMGDDYMMFVVDKFLSDKNIDITYINFEKKVNYFNVDNKKSIEYPLYLKYNNKIIKLFKILKWLITFKANDFDALIFIGGGYTNQDFGYRTLINKYILAKKFKNKKIIFTGQTAGPCYSKSFERILLKFYRLGDRIYVREKYSKKFLDLNNIKSELVCDDAFLYKSVAQKNDNQKIDNIIINYKDFKNYKNYKNKYYSLLLDIIVKSNVPSVIIMPFRSSHSSQEYKDNYELYNFLIKNNIDAKFVIPNDFKELCMLFSKNNIILGEAYHSITLGLLYGNRVFSFYYGNYYEMKIKGVLDLFSMSNCCLDLEHIDDFSTKDILNTIKNESIEKIINQSILMQNKEEKIWNDIIKYISLSTVNN